MPIRHTFQTPIRVDDFLTKSFRFTIKPMANLPTPSQLIVSTSVGGPAVLANYPALAFAETSTGRPSFLVLTLAQQHTETPVTISTDAPDYFQVATDSRPNFASTLTFTPLPTGTYVHIRYLSGRAGLHQGQLFIETPYIRRTVALKGRSQGLLPTVRTPQLLTRLLKTGYPGRALAGGWRARLLAIALVGGFAVGGYSYRCQLFSSLCPDDKASQILTKKNRSNATESMISSKPMLTKVTGESGSVVSRKTRPVSSDSNVSVAKRKLKQTAPNSIRNLRSEAASSGITRNSEGRGALTKQGNNIQAVNRSRPISTTNPASEESELERELNRNF